MNAPALVLIDPDDHAQLLELATLLDVDVDQVRPALHTLRDRQIVDGRIEQYWRSNPQAQPRSRP